MEEKKQSDARKFTKWRARFFALVACVMAVIAMPAQVVADDPDEAIFSEEVAVSEVLVDVVVTAGQDQLVLGLDENDFVVRDDGEPVDVSDVTFYSNRSFLGTSEQAKALNIEVDSVPVNRYFILFFHHQRHLLPRLGANLLDAGRRSKQWVRSSLQPNDYVAVVSYFSKLNVLDFTNDADLLVDTIDLAVQGKDFQGPDESIPSDLPSLTGAMPEGDVDRIYEAIAMVAEGAGVVRGRKNLILYSIGFGQESVFGFYQPDQRYYPPMAKTLNDNHVSVYPIDLLAMDISPSFLINRPDEVLSQMAHDTGGKFFFNFINYFTPLEQITEDNNGYYLLSYQADPDLEPGEYRELEVLAKNADFEVRHREGYVAGEDYPYANVAD